MESLKRLRPPTFRTVPHFAKTAMAKKPVSNPGSRPVVQDLTGMTRIAFAVLAFILKCRCDTIAYILCPVYPICRMIIDGDLPRETDGGIRTG